MRFVVSARGDEERIQGVFRGTYTRIDRRTTDDPSKVPAHAGESDWWYGSGENHRVENGQIARDFPDTEEWFVDFASLEEFADFARQHNIDGITDPFGRGTLTIWLDE